MNDMRNHEQGTDTSPRTSGTAVWLGESVYSSEPPFHPAMRYPESPVGMISTTPNPAYEGVRECLRLLGLDAERFGTPNWNPLSGIVRPGDKVVIKPNFVLSKHSGGGDLFSLITHPSILRAVVDYVYKALDGKGSIAIADSPQMDCSFEELLAATSLASIRDLYRDELRFPIEILDLRTFWLDVRPGDAAAYTDRRFPLPGDPLGSVLINLGKTGAFYNVKNWQAFYGADYTRGETISHHQGDTQEYIVSKTILSADVFISVPKLKVHKKVGTTLNAKGLVGTVTNKNCLVHYTLGVPEEGGDQFPSRVLSAKERFLVKTQRLLFDTLLSKKSKSLDQLYRLIAKVYKTCMVPLRISVPKDKRILDAGNWCGNDSAWRMVVDLMRIITFADADGVVHDTPQRRHFSFIDGIVGGENDGPLAPDAVQSGAVIAGDNLLAVDITATRLMGLDFRKLKWVEYLLNEGIFGIQSENDIRIRSDDPALETLFGSDTPLFRFRPHPGWTGFLEQEKALTEGILQAPREPSRHADAR